MLHKLEGIALHSFKHGDSGRIVKIYTREKGLLSFILRSTYSKRKGSSTALYQSLTILNLDTDIKASSTLHKIREASLARPSDTYNIDPQRAAICMFIAEVFLHAVQEEEANDELYFFLKKWTTDLGIDQELSLLPLRFLLNLSELLGFYPDLTERGNFFDLREGHTVESPPIHPDFLDPEITASFRLIHGMDIAEKRPTSLNRESRRKLLHGLLLYFRIHIHHFKPINSHTVLEETFGR